MDRLRHLHDEIDRIAMNGEKQSDADRRQRRRLDRLERDNPGQQRKTSIDIKAQRSP
jgi:hypothetical protein